LLTTKTSLQGALGTITGQGGMDSFAAPDQGMDELAPADDLGMDDGADIDMDLDIEEPEQAAVGGVGRAKR
jgi:hypothetical protein